MRKLDTALMSQQARSDRLIDLYLRYADKLRYGNLDAQGRYRGWVTDFHVPFRDGSTLSLDLTQYRDIFYLVALAGFWSRHGHWQNAVVFLVYLKRYCSDGGVPHRYWQQRSNVDNEKAHRGDALRQVNDALRQDDDGLLPKFGHVLSIREDFYDTLAELAKPENWWRIHQALDEARRSGGYWPLIALLSTIPGLAEDNKHLRIKIPFVLRELRCQGFDSRIPGAWCCVPDQRTEDASRHPFINLPWVSPYGYRGDVQKVLRASANIYRFFGDYYDLPLFSWQDLEDIVRSR